MFNRVLVPLDGSMLAELALNPAPHLARQTRGAVFLMQVPFPVEHAPLEVAEFDSGWASSQTPTSDHEAADCLRELQGTLARAGVQARTMIVERERAAAIINSSVTCNADLVVMATHARADISRWLFGSIARQVLRQGRCPILFVRRPITFEHLLVVLDGSPSAESAVEPALGLAKAFGSRVTFLGANYEAPSNRANGATVQSRPAESNPYLLGLRAAHKGSDLSIETAVVRGYNHRSILSYAADSKVDLIAMSAHGRGGLGKIIFGSIAETLLHKSGIAMLITRSPVERKK